jgi:hypothetical protein
MGVKATVAATTLTATHANQAAAVGQSATSTNELIKNHINELLTLLNVEIAQMEAGANKTAYQGIVTALT